MSDQPEDRLGITELEWEAFQKATHGFGDQDKNGIDLSLSPSNMRLSPGQRLKEHEIALLRVLEVESAGVAAGIRYARSKARR